MSEPVIALAGLGVAKPIVETGCKLIENSGGEPRREFGGLLADRYTSGHGMTHHRAPVKWDENTTRSDFPKPDEPDP